MAYSNSSTQIILILFTLSLLFSTPCFATNSPSLIQQACSDSGPGTALCIQVLDSKPHVHAATNFFDLCTSTIDAAIENATSVHTHILDLLKDTKEPNVTQALKNCESGYKETVGSLGVALREFRAREPEDPYHEAASYDLFVSGDGVRTCEDAVASGKIGDEIILKGNQVAWIFLKAAIYVIDGILSKS